ncbi:FAD/NAD(P)-binding protein [Streptomyces sp. NPDC059786]|uniref:FAD/NAD(P)-binding protein n=1 Tax=Streptomyces sp. NPDC059786 TaxID=3346946 RepID=UPI00364CE315
MNSVRKRHTVAVVGAGAAGTLTAIQLCETATRRRTPLDLVLVDPAPEAGRGTAYATPDPRHRLNVPAGGMSCYPDDPGHFTRWLCRHGEPTVTGADFATRYRYGAYLADTLGQAVVRAHGTVAVRRLRTLAESCTGTPDGRAELRLADGGRLTADSAVLATGPGPADAAWASPELRAAERFIGTPWAPGALDGPLADRGDGGAAGGPPASTAGVPAGSGPDIAGVPAGSRPGTAGVPAGSRPGTADVLLVGTGLTAVDLALTLDRPGRTVHAVSRGGLLPQPHALTPAGVMDLPEDLDDSRSHEGSDGGCPPEGAGGGSDGARLPGGSGGGHLPAGSGGSRLPEGSDGTRLPAGSGGSRLPEGSGGGRLSDGSGGGRLSDGSGGGRLPALRRTVYRHISRAVRIHGDWRPALDSLRPHTARLWHSLTPGERAEFLAREGALWNTHRHRMAPATAESVLRARTARRLRVHTGTVDGATVRADGSLDVRLSDGRTLHVGWVIDCTGPGRRPGGPLWRSLLDSGAAVPGPLGMGVATRDGRLVDAAGRTDLPVYTLGAPRRGELWETTAVPEIRVQAAALAEELLASPARPARATRRPRRRPVDPHGLPLSTHAEAAAAHRTGLDRVLKVRAGAEDAFARAVALDPGFALGHAALALLGHECGAAVDVPRALADAQRSARERADARERSFVDVVTRRVHGDGGDAALLGHLDAHPGDALALAVAVPTIAFSGVSDLDDDYALRLLERTSPAHDGHWFHTSLLAFLRQGQGRLHEAGELAHRALAVEPASGHAVHALAHVHYESGAHTAGRDWLDGWISGQGRGAVHRAHFSWHVALHELALDDPAAVRKRWFAQLAPGRVTGVRALVDSGSLLWRARLSGNWRGLVPAADVLETVARDIVERPATAFTALHAAVALAAAGDLPALRRLRDHARGADPVQREIIVPLCESFAALVEERFQEAARGLDALLPVLRKVGGSAAQREVVEETLLYALVSAGRCGAARRLLDARLDRGAAPRDRRLRAALPG